MDTASIAAAAAGAHRAQTVAAIATEVLKQKHAQDQAMVALLETAVQSAKEGTRASASVAGSAGIVDIKA